LWICGVLQIVSNLGYAVVAVVPPTVGNLALPWVEATVNLPLQSAIFIETLTGGMGWGAFGVLLLRLTDKRFPATQYALFSSLVGLARTFVGPPAGVMADALGWRDFFILTMAFGIPGMVMLKRFVPWGQDPKEVSGDAVEPLPPGAPWSRQALLTRGLVAGVMTGGASLLLSISLVAIKGWRETRLFDFSAAAMKVLKPAEWTQGIDLVNALVFALMGGVAVAAYLAARGRPGNAAPPEAPRTA
jgi:PAT family beta-lactamase induction signal transducer AmpG